MNGQLIGENILEMMDLFYQSAASYDKDMNAYAKCESVRKYIHSLQKIATPNKNKTKQFRWYG
jgi:hypothetical protein